jgi:hypothetical protein
MDGQLNKYKYIDMKYGYMNYNVKFIQSSLNIYYKNQVIQTFLFLQNTRVYSLKPRFQEGNIS